MLFKVRIDKMMIMKYRHFILGCLFDVDLILMLLLKIKFVELMIYRISVAVSGKYNKITFRTGSIILIFVTNSCAIK